LDMGFAVPALSRRDDRPDEDHIVHLDGVSWEDYERVLAMRGERSAPRIAYLEGLLEIMMPGRKHENIKSLIGRLVEVWCIENGMRFTALGSWTLKEKKAKRGAEPDECYVLGGADEERRPDLAIEVEWTSGRIDKLDIYRKLGVREIWYWRNGVLQPYALRGTRYVKLAASKVLPRLDLAQLVSFLDRPTTYDAMQDYRRALRKRRA
jgi:Uma2 family endonuclease